MLNLERPSNTAFFNRLAGDVAINCLETFTLDDTQTTIALVTSGLGKFGVVVETSSDTVEILVTTTRFEDAVQEYRYAVQAQLLSGAQRCRRRSGNTLSLGGLAEFRAAVSFITATPFAAKTQIFHNISRDITVRSETAELRSQTFYGMQRHIPTKPELIPKSAKMYVAEPTIVDYPAKVFASGKRPLLLEGPAGSGKSLFVEWLSYESGLPLYAYAHNAHTETDDILGKVVPQGRNDFVFVDGPLTMAVELGGIFFGDEITACKPGTTMIYNQILNGEPLVVPGAAGYRTIRPHANFRFVAACNPANAYEGNHAMNLSQIDRYVIFHWSYPTYEYETQAILANVPAIGKTAAEALATIAYTIRNKLKELPDTRYTISTRTLIKCAELVTDIGCSLHDAARISILEPARLFEGETILPLIEPVLQKYLNADFSAIDSTG